MKANLLNGVSEDTVLYRYYSLNRFRELVSDKELVLVRPSMWPDPFEDFLSRTETSLSGEKVQFDLTKEYVGQCWTVAEECDGLWRNYCGLDNGVRISTTAGKLLSAIWDHNDKYASLHTFVGGVKYLSDTEIKASLKGCLVYGHDLTDPNGTGIAQTLLVKRTEFAYEREVRALATQNDTEYKIKKFGIDPVVFIDEVMYSPQLSIVIQKAIQSILGSVGMPQSKISRSSLYDPWSLKL